MLWAGLLAAVAVVPAFSQTEPAAPTSGPVPVIVNNVRFNSVSGTGWYEMDIQLQTAPGQQGSQQLTGRLKVGVDLGIEARLAGGSKMIDFYHSSAQFVGLPMGGGTYDVRFYLPPEIVARDGIQGPAKYYCVELSVDGKTLPMTKNNVSFSTLNTPQILESFRAKVSSDGEANNGIFLPQYLTPFGSDFSRPTPSALRIEAAH